MIELTGVKGPVFVRYDHVQAIEEVKHPCDGAMLLLRRLQLTSGSVLVRENAGEILTLLQQDHQAHPSGAPLQRIFNAQGLSGTYAKNEKGEWGLHYATKK